MSKKQKLIACADCEGTEYYIMRSRLRSHKIVCNGCGKVCGFASTRSGATKVK